MKITLPNYAYQIPSIQQFINALADDLANRRSLFVLLPKGVDSAEVSSFLKAELWRRDFEYEELVLSDSSKNLPPLSFLSSTLGVQWPSVEMPRTCTNFFNISHNLPDVILLEGLDMLPENLFANWLAFVEEWVQASHSMADRGHKPIALCMIMSAAPLLSHMPDTDIHLGIYWWWGFPSALEIRLICRLYSNNENWNNMARWREYLMPALVGSDISLVKNLWNDLNLNIESISERLISFGEQRGWDKEALNSWGANDLNSTFSSMHAHFMVSPPEYLQRLWAHGALSWSQEYGIELHAAALAILERTEELKHRIWRGQAELLLPLIDQCRLSLCERLTHSYGRDWPVKWDKPKSKEENDAVQKNPLACQLGYLEYLLKNYNHLRSGKKWLPLVSIARGIRNKMAHYHPAAFGDFETLLRKVHEVELKISQ